MASNYVDVLLAVGGDGTTRTFVVPTSTARVGDVVLHQDRVFSVTNTAWVSKDSDVHILLEGSTTLYVPDKLLRVQWEKQEEVIECEKK